jgi:hypothetical protein
VPIMSWKFTGRRLRIVLDGTFWTWPSAWHRDMSRID